MISGTESTDVNNLTLQLQNLQLDEAASNQKQLSHAAREHTPPKIAPLNAEKIPFVPNRHIDIPKETLLLINKLEAAGFEVFLGGGYVRDQLLKLPHQDIDLNTNCSKEEIVGILGEKCLQSTFDKQLFQFDNFDIRCTSLSLLQEAQNRDITINALFADRFGRIYDPLHIIDDLDKPHLEMIGVPLKRFEEDRKRPFRLLRVSNQVNKTISNELIEDLKQSVGSVNRLPFGVYLNSIKKLFTRGYAALTIDFLKKNDLLSLISFKQDSKNDPLLQEFQQSTLEKLDKEFKQGNNKGTIYHVMALLLLADLLNACEGNSSKAIGMAPLVIEAFCAQYQGEFSLVDQNCFKNATLGLLLQYHTDYLKTHLKPTAEDFVPMQVSQQLTPQFQDWRDKQPGNYENHGSHGNNKKYNRKKPSQIILNDFIQPGSSNKLSASI